MEARGPDDPALDAAERALGDVTFEVLSGLDGPSTAEALRPLADAYEH